MKPLVLTLENFGPYRQEEVNFEAFADFPLFLITGKTGSGKTTLFDGMCFALYGEATGETRQAKEMRSNFASATEKTSVCLVFEHLDQRYEISREPFQLLQKKNGKGLTKKEAKVTLKIYDKDQTIVSELSGNQPVKLKIEELLQLNVQQFRQIILLPQGEFRKFLNASSNDKEKVLRRLFGTDIYSQMGLKIKEQKAQEEKRLAKDEQKLLVLFEQAKITKEEQQALAERRAIEEKFEWLEQMQQKLQKEEQEITIAYETCSQAYEISAENLRDAQQLKEKFIQKEQLLLEKEQLQTQAATIAVDEATLKRLHVLEQIAPIVEQWQQAETEEESLKTAIITLEQEQTAHKKQQQISQERQQELVQQTQAMAQNKQQLQQIEHVLPIITEYQKLSDQIKQQLVETTERGSQLEQLDAHVRSTESSFLNNQERLTDEAILLKQLHQVTNDRDNLLRYQENCQVLIEKNAQKEQQVAEIETLKTALKTAKTTLEKAEQAYLEKKSIVAQLQIARLRLDLLPGAPCPVCGSLEHSTEQESLTYSQADINEAEQALLLAEEQQSTARETYVLKEQLLAQQNKEQLALSAALLEQTTALLQQLEMQLLITAEASLTMIEQKLAEGLLEKNEAKKEIEQELQVLSQLALEQEELHQRLIAQREKYHKKEMSVQAEQTKLLRLEAAAEQLERQLPSDWQTSDYQDKQIQLQQTLQNWEELTTRTNEELVNVTSQLEINLVQITAKKEQFAQIGLKIATYQTRLKPQLDGLNLPLDLHVLQSQLAELLVKQELEEKVRAYYDQTLRLQSLLDSLETSLNGAEIPDLLPLETALEQLKIKRAALSEQRILLKQTQTDNANLLAKIKKMYQELQSDWQTLTELTQLANVANGDGQYKLGFERFVLQVYFAETLKLANQKLRQLSNQRYTFELDDTLGSYRKNTGLELNIYDDNIGAMRSVNTLSGGESFIAALSLALALGEVVQAQAGGIRIDAMFIDEGFGSLDEDSLEMAITALEAVESRGRVIGIISHVRELKQRIIQQIQVVSLGTGESHIRYQGIES